VCNYTFIATNSKSTISYGWSPGCFKQ
jgi:hypothetical protein